VKDSASFWIDNGAREENTSAFQLRSFHLYYSTNVSDLLSLGLSVRPVFFNTTFDENSILYTAYLDDSGKTATFSQVARVRRIETIYNAGGDADISVSLKFSPISWFYFRTPFEYRRYWGSSVDVTADVFSRKDSLIDHNDTLHAVSIVQTHPQGRESPDQYLASVAPQNKKARVVRAGESDI
jgi:hypothetical protein